MIETILIGSDVDSLIRIAISAPLLYMAVVGFIRVSGKRSTSQMNNFDWIVTVAIGSLVGSGVILKDVGVIEVMLAIGLLLGLQYLLTWGVIRSESVANLVKASPCLLVFEGKMLKPVLRKERISAREIMAAIREKGLLNIEQVHAMVLETDATFSVIPLPEADTVNAALDDVANFPPQ